MRSPLRLWCGVPAWARSLTVDGWSALMLEMLLRLLGLKRRRRRRVYVQPPMPPGVGQGTRRSSGGSLAPGDLRREAEIQTAEAARKFQREREARKGKKSGWADVPVIGAWFKPRRVRVESPIPPQSNRPQPQVRRSTGPEPGMRMDAPTRVRRPPRTVLRELRDGFAKGWAGPAGQTFRKVTLIGMLVVIPVFGVLVPGYFIVEEMRNIGIEVRPFVVPAETAKTGRTPEVLAQLLIDQIDVARRETLIDRGERWQPDVGSRQPSFDLATQADTLHTIAVWLRGLTPRPVRTVTAAVTQLADGKLSLRIYMTGMNRGAPVAALEGFNTEDLNRVVAGAAPLVLRAATPRLYAWYLANHEQRPEALQAGLHALLTDPANGVADTATRDTAEFLIARNMARGGRPDEAMELADELIKRSPRYAPGHFARALAFLAHDDPDAALLEAEEARKIDGGSAWSYKVMGRVLLSVRRYADALAEIRVARRLDPNDGAAIVLEAETLMSMRRVEEASTTVRTGLERAPGQPGILEAASAVMLARGHPDVAIGLINDELRQRPERVSALIMKARLLSAIGRGEEALAAADTSLRLQPSNGMAQAARGYALVAASRPTEALTLFERLIDSAPENPMVRQGRALALAQLGRRDEAIAEFRRVLELQPDFAAARREMDKLRNTDATALPAVPTAKPIAPVKKTTSETFITTPVDVGPAPTPPVPQAQRSQTPAPPGTFDAQRQGAPMGAFRRPDSEDP